MVAPASYTEQTLAVYMATILGASNAGTLGWPDAGEIADQAGLGDYQEPVNETLLALGYDDPVEADDAPAILALRAVARWQVWRAARMAVADRYDESLGSGISMKRSQLFEMALRNERREEAAAAGYVTALGMVVSIIPELEPTETETEFG
jgi:hypothetical protein